MPTTVTQPQNHFPGLISWPCGTRPYGQTLRAWYYRTTFLWPRIFMWTALVLPPFVVMRVFVPNAWPLGTRLVVNGLSIGLLVLLTAVIDSILYGRIFDGFGDTPGIRQAAEICERWRRDWVRFEAVSEAIRSKIKTGNRDEVTVAWAPRVCFRFHGYRCQDFPLVQIQNRLNVPDSYYQQVITTIFSHLFLEFPLAIGGMILWHDNPAGLFLIPAAAFGTNTVYFWVILQFQTEGQKMLMRLETGWTQWWPALQVNDGRWYRGDLAESKFLAFKRFLSPVAWVLASFVFLFQLAFAWIVYPLAACREVITRFQFNQFAQGAEPGLGDSLDLALICQNRNQHPTELYVVADEMTRKALQNKSVAILIAVQKALNACGAP